MESIRISYINPNSSRSTNFVNQIEIGLASSSSIIKNNETDTSLENDSIKTSNDDDLKCNSDRYLCYVELGYLSVIHIFGSILVSLYVIFVPRAKQVLKKKSLHSVTFSVFTTVSTSANCGFVPTNKSMMVFKKFRSFVAYNPSSFV